MPLLNKIIILGSSVKLIRHMSGCLSVLVIFYPSFNSSGRSLE